MTEEYISGYLESVSRVKDILTPHVGGTNQFFSIEKDKQKSLTENILRFINNNKDYYLQFGNEEKFKSDLEKIELKQIDSWEENFQKLIENWTCDKILSEKFGKNGYYLSEYLIRFLLADFFKNKNVKLYKMLPDWSTWHWGDQMSDEFIFEIDDKIYIMHFGESS